jgi:hypothetical protein
MESKPRPKDLKKLFSVRCPTGLPERDEKRGFRMSTRHQLSICLVLIQLLAATAFSADRASRMDAKAMLNKAIAQYKLVGCEQALYRVAPNPTCLSSLMFQAAS